MAKSNDRVLVSAEYRLLKNGKYQGVVVQSLIGRISSDNFEFPCVNEYPTKEEALREAKQVVEKNGQHLGAADYLQMPLATQFAVF